MAVGRWSGGAAAVVLALVAGCKRDAGSGAPADAGSAVSAAPLATAPVNATPLASASVAAFVNPSNLPVYKGPTGSIEGHVTIVGDPAPDAPEQDFHACPAGRDVYGKLFREGPPDVSGARPLADALVAVTGYSGFYVAEGNDAKAVTIQKCAFSARTIDMTIGQRLDITNDSDLLVAPALAQEPLPALMVAAPHGGPVQLYPRKPRYDVLVDRMTAPFMRADVYILHFPLHAVTSLDGHYRIDGVPIGKLIVNARLGPIRQETSKPVEVRANVVQTVDLQLTYKTAPPPGPPVDAGAIPQRLINN
jgi:hypothetical protein